MKLLITICQDEDGVFIAECPSIPGCVSQGKTEEEAEKNVREAIKECLEVRAEKGLPLTVTTREVEVVRNFPVMVAVNLPMSHALG
jgi:predicted RNase H-like HicB family nuclease